MQLTQTSDNTIGEEGRYTYYGEDWREATTKGGVVAILVAFCFIFAIRRYARYARGVEAGYKEGFKEGRTEGGRPRRRLVRCGQH
jgi:flagellar biosynthesis/type III secretory pathway protein FliH